MKNVANLRPVDKVKAVPSQKQSENELGCRQSALCASVIICVLKADVPTAGMSVRFCLCSCTQSWSFCMCLAIDIHQVCNHSDILSAYAVPKRSVAKGTRD